MLGKKLEMFTGEIIVYIMKQFVVLVTKVIAMEFL